MVSELLLLLLHEALPLPYVCHCPGQKPYEHLLIAHILPVPVLQNLKLSNHSAVYPLFLLQLSAILFRPDYIEFHIRSYVRLLRLGFLAYNAEHQSSVLLPHHLLTLMSLFCVLALNLLLLRSSLYANVYSLFRQEHILQDLH